MALNKILNEMYPSEAAVNYIENYQNIILPNLQNMYVNRFKESLDLLNFNTSTFICDKVIENPYQLSPIFNQWDFFSNKLCYVSDSPDVLRLISNAIANGSRNYIYSVISEKVQSCPSIEYFLNNTKNNLIHYNFISEQQHLIRQDEQSMFSIRLGAVKNSPVSTFPYLFNSEFILLNINCLKFSDAPAQKGNNPSGLTSEEGNQIAFMAGQSPINKFFIVYGIEELERDPDGVTMNAISQLLWYYNYGATRKLLKLPEGLSDQYQEYSIESSNMSENIVFVKDTVSGNWFHKLPFKVPEVYSHHQWIAATYEEYLEASDDNIPYRLLEIYEAFNEMRSQ